MNMQQIRELAKEKGAKIGKMGKVDAVRMIQLTEGNYDCFASSGAEHCDQGNCLFKADCVEIAMKSN
jgi:hypothetical protein